MKRTLYFLLLTAFTTLSAQPDLSVAAFTYEPDLIDRGDVITLRATVVNVGDVTAAENYVFFFYSTDLTISDDEIVSRVSIPALGPGESHDLTFLYPVAATLVTGDYYVGIEIDPFNAVSETDENNLFCAGVGPECGTFTVASGPSLPGQRFTYPVLFIHGLNGNSRTWNEFTSVLQRELGWVNGGRLDYCLNPDNNQTTSDGSILSFVNTEQLKSGDFYRLNFDVNAAGRLFVSDDGIPFNNFESNQSAIVKQGWAVRDAVEKVLTFSGADRVIIVGHSMGGLAGRQYINNPELWQDDGDHHIAKLLTVGTPHGGSNLNTVGLGQIFTGIDERSEATRDLRYRDVLFGGQFLDGGVETSLSAFYNGDVNANGIVGDLIIGLNEKVATANIDYACIIGVGNNFPSLSGDGIVDADRADLNNYLLAPPPLVSLTAERFFVDTEHTDLHKENTSVMLRAMDEPDEPELAYQLPLEQLHFAFISEQRDAELNGAFNDNPDYDDFRITLPEAGRVDVYLWNVPVPEFGAFLVSGNNTLEAFAQSDGSSEISFSVDLPAGDYLLEVGGLPTPNSWRFPYAHFVDFTPAEPLVANISASTSSACTGEEIEFSDTANGEELSYAWSFPGGTPSSSTVPNPSVSYGEAGIYPVTLIISDGLQSDTLTREQYITIQASATAGFDFSFDNNLSVAFTNTTTFTGGVPTYLWDFGDGNTSAEPEPTHLFPSTEQYTVTLFVTDSCGTDTLAQIVDLTTVSTQEVILSKDLLLSPNPASESVLLRYPLPGSGSVQLNIISGSGQVVRSIKVDRQSVSGGFQLRLQGLAPAIYVVQVNGEEGVISGKLVVE